MSPCRQCQNPLEKGLHTCGRDPFNLQYEYLQAKVADLESAKTIIIEALGDGADEGVWPPGTPWHEAAAEIIYRYKDLQY